MKNYQLIELDIEMSRLPNVLKYLHRSAISAFVYKYGIRVETTRKRLDDLQKEYFVVKENKIVMTEPPALEKKELSAVENAEPAAPFVSKPVMQEGKTLEEFDKKYAELMNSDINFAIVKM